MSKKGPKTSRERLLEQVKAANKRAEIDASTEGSAEEYVDYYGYVQLGVSVLKVFKNLSLVGPTGTGKSHLVRAIQGELQDQLGESVKLFIIRGAGDLMNYSLWTDIDLVANPDGQGSIKDIAAGEILAFLIYDGPAMLLWDEVNMTPEDIISASHGITDHTMSKTLTDLKDDDGIPMEIKRGSDKYIVIAYNPSERSEYGGTRPLNAAFQRRFTGFWVEYLPEDEERQILLDIGLNVSDASRLSGMAMLTRRAYEDGKLRVPLTLGNIKAYAKLIVEEGLEFDDIGTLILGMYPSTQHELAKALWGKSGNGS